MSDKTSARPCEFLAGFREPTDQPRHFVSGSSCFLRDEDGREYLDLSSQYWNVNLGHQNPELLARLKEAMDHHLFVNLRFGHTSAQQALARRLGDLFGQRFPAVQTMTSASMAVEASIKIARQVTGREEIASFHQSFHGMSLAALSSTGYDDIVLLFGRRDPRHKLVHPFRCSLCPYGKSYPECDIACADKVVRFIHRRRKKLAAFVAEPVISNQVITPPPEFWPRVSEACQDTGVLLIADEAVSGLGRSGAWLGADRVGMKPDMVVLGKGLTSGTVPFAAIMHGQRTASFYQGRTLHHGQAFDGYDLGCRAALGVVDIVEKQGLIRRVWELEKRMARSLEAMARRVPAIHDVRGWGLLWGIELSPHVLPKESLHSFAVTLQQRLLERRLLLGGLGRVVIFAPPFVISDEDLERGLTMSEEALTQALRDCGADSETG